MGGEARERVDGCGVDQRAGGSAGWVRVCGFACCRVGVPGCGRGWEEEWGEVEVGVERILENDLCCLVAPHATTLATGWLWTRPLGVLGRHLEAAYRNTSGGRHLVVSRIYKQRD